MADGITIRAETLRFNGKEFTSKMNKEMEGLFIEAARAFLIAAVRRIPVRTAFLRGAFGTLEDVVGAYQIGASKTAPRLTGKNRSPAIRPNRDTTVVANRLARLRDIQKKLLKQIKTFHASEAARRQKLNRKIATLQDQQGGFVHEKQLNAILRVNRNTALRERNTARFLIKRAKANEAAIAKAVEQFERKTKLTLRSKVEDARNKIRLSLRTIQQKRNENFQEQLKRLKRLYLGQPSQTPGKFGVRGKGTISGEEFNRRLTKLREKMTRETKRQSRLKESLKRQPGKLTEKMKSKLSAYADKLKKKYKARLDAARDNDDDSARDEVFQEIREKVEKAKRRLSRRRQSTGDKLIKLLQLRQKTTGSLDTQERLNVVARTTRGRIVGQTQPGRFNLRGGERVKTIFNQKGIEDRFEEFYYPVKGSPNSRILKTPRSGRRFAVPSPNIIQKVTQPPSSSANLLRQLVGIIGPSGTNRRLHPGVDAAIQDVAKTVTYYRFHYAIDISYLAINEFKQTWFAWTAGIAAFNQVIAAKAPGRLPKLSNFMLREERRLTGQTRSVQISGRL